jgi:H+/Cl- antiporter ClcA
MNRFGEMLVAVGVAMVVLGVIFFTLGHLSGKVSWLGRLPGDIYIQRGTWSLYVPLATCLLLSVILTLVFSLFGRR